MKCPLCQHENPPDSNFCLGCGAHLGLVAHCHLGFGKLYRRASKRQEAQEHLTTAVAMYREMDMRFWLEPAEGELKALA